MDTYYGYLQAVSHIYLLHILNGTTIDDNVLNQCCFYCIPTYLQSHIITHTVFQHLLIYCIQTILLLLFSKSLGLLLSSQLFDSIFISNPLLIVLLSPSFITNKTSHSQEIIPKPEYDTLNTVKFTR